jgi:UDP-N-acetylmuramoylalanine--D-glutamate ligase
MDAASIHSKTFSVIGAVRSGVAVASLLKTQGAKVFVSDSSPAEKLQTSIETLRAEGIEFETGRHSGRVYDGQIMVVSPGVPGDAPVVLEAKKRNMPVFSELEVASWFCHSPIAAITGSNGKTTTTTLIGRMLSDAKKKHVVAGNIGTAFSSVVVDLAPMETAVLEVSSFQLDFCETFRPKISVLLNITPDHMDRYEHSMELYAASKARIFSNQREEDVLIYNADDEWTTKVVHTARARKICFTVQQKTNEGAYLENDRMITSLGGINSSIIDVSQIFIKGTHNLYNAMAATLVGQLLGVTSASIRSTLKTFEGVEHRLEFVRELNKVQYYNDSKATNVDSVWYALQSFQEPLVLLLGGRDKGNDYSRLVDLVKNQVRAIIALGESAEIVENAFRGTTVIKRASSMDEAVSTAHFLALPGDVVLLSPACASFDWFENYEHRGRVFKEFVNAL